MMGSRARGGSGLPGWFLAMLAVLACIALLALLPWGLANVADRVIDIGP